MKLLILDEKMELCEESVILIIVNCHLDVEDRPNKNNKIYFEGKEI